MTDNNAPSPLASGAPMTYWASRHHPTARAILLHRLFKEPTAHRQGGQLHACLPGSLGAIGGPSSKPVFESLDSDTDTDKDDIF